MPTACEIDALPVVLPERAGAAGVLGAVAGGVLGGHTRELPQEAGGVRAEPAEDLGDERDDLLAAREGVRVVAQPRCADLCVTVSGRIAFEQFITKRITLR